jgi:uncharacterized membrane protein
VREIDVLDLAALLSALGCGLIAGVFFAFSAFVMKALGKLAPPQGIAAMQSINVVVINRWFLTAFFGTAAVCVFALIASVLRWHEPGTQFLVLGSALYLVGAILVTMLFNVPLNNALAAVVPPTPEAARIWAAYLNTWTAWNHVRTVAALVASALFIIAFRFRA